MNILFNKNYSNLNKGVEVYFYFKNFTNMHKKLDTFFT